MTDRPPKDHAYGLAREDGTIDGGAILRLLDRPLTDADLREATRRVASPMAPSKEHVEPLLLFHACGEFLALPAITVTRVTRVAPVHRIPHRSNKVIRGLCNIQGDLMICGNLVSLLELVGDVPASDDDRSDDDRRMIVLGDEAEPWAVQVDSVDGVAYLDPQTFKKPPITVERALHRYTDRLVPTVHSLASLLNVERVLSGFQAALS